MAKETPHSTVVAYGKRLRKARQNAGVSQAEVAAAIGCQQSFISKAEHGQMMLRPIDYPPVADLLGVSVLDLIGRLTEEEQKEIQAFEAEIVARHEEWLRDGAS